MHDLHPPLGLSTNTITIMVSKVCARLSPRYQVHGKSLDTLKFIIHHPIEVESKNYTEEEGKCEGTSLKLQIESVCRS